MRYTKAIPATALKVVKAEIRSNITPIVACSKRDLWAIRAGAEQQGEHHQAQPHASVPTSARKPS
jgi:hypothetical protein